MTALDILLSNRILEGMASGHAVTLRVLSERLNQPKQDIERQLSVLREGGFPVQKLGTDTYHLCPLPNWLNIDRVVHSMQATSPTVVPDVHYHRLLDSTNLEAIRQRVATTSTSSLVIAEGQVLGRGRRGKSWITPFARNLCFSVGHRFGCALDQLVGLSLVVALSVVRAIPSLPLTSGTKVQVKWPNDILLNDCKLAGILLEIKPDFDGAFVVIGIGINTDCNPDGLGADALPSCNLNSVTLQNVQREQVLSAVLNQLFQDLQEFSRSGFSSFQTLWQNSDSMIGRDVVVIQNDRQIFGRYLGVNSLGAIRIAGSAGVTEIHSGEMAPSLRPSDTGCASS